MHNNHPDINKLTQSTA